MKNDMFNSIIEITLNVIGARKMLPSGAGFAAE
jgi:hypothetical protein